MLKANDFRDKSEEELIEALDKSKLEIFALRAQMHTGQEQKIHLIGHKKKEIARILTVLREKAQK